MADFIAIKQIRQLMGQNLLVSQLRIFLRVEMFRLYMCVVCFLLVASNEYHYGLINFPSVIYVKPGDDFQLPCKSDNGGAVRVRINEELMDTFLINSFFFTKFLLNF